MISAPQAGFSNKFIARAAVLAPNVDQTLVMITGASELRRDISRAAVGCYSRSLYGWAESAIRHRYCLCCYQYANCFRSQVVDYQGQNVNRIIASSEHEYEFKR